MPPISEIVGGIVISSTSPACRVFEMTQQVSHDFISSEGKPELARPILLECRHGSDYDPPECGL